MQESIQAAMTVVRSRSAMLGLDVDFYQKADVHIHVPEGATPKDGPSAIGGLKEKLLAAHRGGITTVLIPDENTKDLAEIPDNIKEKLDIRPVKWIDEVLQVALTHMPTPLAAPSAKVKPPEAMAGEKKRRVGRVKSQVRAH